MVGEVFRVIRNLAARKMTMLIVTHEMRFARDVANRVFYLDEGVLYEEGMPQEIFENPKREKTRQFIRQLRTLSLRIVKSVAEEWSYEYREQNYLRMRFRQKD